ncbi:endoplasmic oxidoreductin [Neoconidiobolus thromboides FSU 785]|nr:endoplasmic oxidoreductin [Neoconidiobolus thromboides FSU 785]
MRLMDYYTKLQALKNYLFIILLLLFFTCLPLYATIDTTQHDEFVKEVLEKKPGVDYCRPPGMIHDSCCDYKTVEEINSNLLPLIHNLLETPFFSHYKINLHKQCPFYNANELCSRVDCSVSTLDESEVPATWLTEKLSQVDMGIGRMGLKQIKKCTYTDKDFCVLEDEESDEGQYVNLLKNPERFTGYGGDSAAQVWKAIYEENCFNFLNEKENSLTSNLMSNDLLMGLCKEKRIFYRLISGLHASISTHICSDYYNTKTESWEPNLECFISRVGSHPDRLENMYFNYMLLLRAVTKVTKYLENYQYCSLDQEQNSSIKELLSNIKTHAKNCPATFDENNLFVNKDAKLLKTEFKQHFRNISQVMDCIGCQKCRLWGKIQTGGFGTALKILFSYEEKSLNPKRNPDLFKKTEIVALFNTFGRLAESIASVEMFREMYLKKYNFEKDEKKTSKKENGYEKKTQKSEDVKENKEDDSEYGFEKKDVNKNESNQNMKDETTMDKKNSSIYSQVIHFILNSLESTMDYVDSRIPTLKYYRNLWIKSILS